jgi:hypothetical protein
MVAVLTQACVLEYPAMLIRAVKLSIPEGDVVEGDIDVE